MTLPRIGVFDSGVGGLTVLKAMAEQLPAHYIYFGDTARLPYGTKSAETVARYAIGATHFLEAQEIDLLVIACNTATALALPAIEAAAHVPVIGVVRPGAAMAAEVSKNRSAIVIATEATVSSHAYRNALQDYGLQALEKACPLFVPLVEEGWIEHQVTEQVARIYLGEAMAQAPEGADVLVLACTRSQYVSFFLFASTRSAYCWQPGSRSRSFSTPGEVSEDAVKRAQEPTSSRAQGTEIARKRPTEPDFLLTASALSEMPLWCRPDCQRTQRERGCCCS